MKLPTQLVAVRRITSNVPRSNFSPDEIEKTARLILDVEGVITPLILRHITMTTYEVVDGDFQYYAAVRAREIDNLKGEKIQAIILEPENEEVLLEQVKLIRNKSDSSSVDVNIDQKLSNLEKNFQSQFEELRKDYRNLNKTVNELAGSTNNNGLTGKIVNEIVQRVVEAIKPKPSYEININLASRVELQKLKYIGNAKADEIMRERQKSKFTSIDDFIHRVQGITENRVNEWYQTYEIIFE